MNDRPKAEYAGQYAISEVDFWLTDPRIKGVGATAKVFYHYAWIIAVKERREVLPPYWTPRAIGLAAGLDTKTTPKAYRTLLENSLLGQAADGCVIVYGVINKHRKLKWKDRAVSIERRPQMEKETEVEVEVEVEGDRAAAPPTESQPTSGDGREQQGREIRSIEGAWKSRFPQHRLSFVQYAQIRSECERLGISPVLLLQSIPVAHKEPWKYMCGYLNGKYSCPEPGGPACGEWSFFAWQKSLDDSSAAA